MIRIGQAVLVTLVAVVAALVGGMTVSTRTAGSAAPSTQAADVAVSCGAGHRAEVRQTLTTGAPKVTLDCVPDAAALPVMYAPAAAQMAPRATAQPVLYGSPGISAVSGQEIAATRPVSRAPRTAVRARQKSTWQKRALIIGGSAGAGAGIGALTGGKKGALIGAAIGGGGAAIIDAVRNR
jgi:hypothetical protein